jgi:hypothetical protein
MLAFVSSICLRITVALQHPPFVRRGLTVWRPARETDGAGIGPPPGDLPMTAPDAFDDSRKAPDNPGLLYATAALGTAVAGGLFPLAVATYSWPPTVTIRGVSHAVDLGEALSFVFVASVAAFFFAAATALSIFPLVGVLDWLASLKRWRGVLVSCAGGWCGFASVATLTQQARSDGALSLSFVAMAMGQLGAGMAVRLRNRRRRSMVEASPRNSEQLPLRQLFGITTAVAIATAVLASLPIASHMLVAMALAATCQILVIAGYVLVRHVWGSRAAG